MNSAQPAPTQSTTRLPAAFPLAAFYAHLQHHNWFYCFSEDRSVYHAGEESEKRLERLARESGPVHEWLWVEFSKHMGSGRPWNTKQHPLPPAPVELTDKMAISIRISMAKAELVAAALRIVKPFLPGDVAQIDPVWPILQKVLYLGAYSGKSAPPALIASHPKLAGAWEQGQQLVADKAHPTV